ncbi:MAG: twin-arginine translocation signal domain-containing protein [Desulfobacteraceae bacterium]|nr:twin-arginine translocation signal domain-containing protein [Desulfobacteraceae bacterium]
MAKYFHSHILKEEPMSDHTFSRRDFLKTASAAGAASMLSPFGSLAMAEEKASVSTRPFGKTGVNVSTLALGTMFDTGSNQLLLRQAIQMGVTYWDTADCYERRQKRGRHRQIFC